MSDVVNNDRPDQGSQVDLATGEARRKSASSMFDQPLQKILTKQFGRAFLLIVSISFILAFAISYYSASLINEDGRRRSIETFAKSVEPLLARYDLGDVENLLTNAREINGLANIRLIDHYGRIHGGLDNGQVFSNPDMVVPLNYGQLGKIGDVQLWWADDRSLLLLLFNFIAVWAAQMLIAWFLSALFLGRVLSRHVVDPLTTLQDQVNFLENRGNLQDLEKFEGREFNSLSTALGEAWDAARQSSKRTERAFARTASEMKQRLAITHVVENALTQAQMSIIFSVDAEGEVTRLGDVNSCVVDLVLPNRDMPPESIVKKLTEQGYNVTLIRDNITNESDQKNQKVFTLEIECSPAVVCSITYIRLKNNGFALISIDISEQKEVHKALQQSLKLEAMGSLTSGVAHDFNNILAIISGALEMAMIDGSDQSHLKKARFASIRGAALVRQLLNVSRDEQQTLSPINLATAIKNLSHVLPASLGSDHRLTILGSTEKYALAEADTFETSLINLVMNARGAMDDGGEIKIVYRDVSKQESVLHGLSVTKDYVAIDVIDQGVGISEDIQTRIFDPFFTTKKIGSGTGLGLSMVDGFATRSGGKVICVSVSGQGARFTIYLPAADKTKLSEEHIPETHDRPTGATRNRKVLIVDDEGPLSHLLSTFLGHHGYIIDTAEDYGEAEKLYEDMGEDSYEIIIADMYMPGGTGLDLLRRTAGLVSPPFRILMSGNVQEKNLSDEEKSFCDYVVQKPFSLRDMLEVIDRNRPC